MVVEREIQAGVLDPDGLETLMEKPATKQIRESVLGFDIHRLYHQVGIVLVAM